MLPTVQKKIAATLLEEKMTETAQIPWYSQSAPSDDVIISSHVRLARNLANFPFPLYLSDDDKMRVQSLFFDGFSKIQSENELLVFHALNTDELELTGRRILEEDGLLKHIDSKNKNQKETGIVIGKETSFSALINYGDHVRLSSFRSGLIFEQSFNECILFDQKLQDNLQFASTYDFGYLTAAFRDTGTGMKLSARIHIPGIVRSGKLRIISDYLSEKKIAIKPAFPEISDGSVAGSFYLIHTTSAMSGTELDQIADFESACLHIAESERKILADYADNKATVVFNSVLRSYAVAKFSMLLSLRDAVEIISDLKIGLKCGFLSGFSEDKENVLSGLLFRIKPGHLGFLLKNGNFSFEKDILNDEKAKIDRLRALMLQETVQKLSLKNT